jgi:hypothetical protein
MASWWDSISTMRRVVDATIIAAILFFLLGITTWPITRAIGIPAFVLGTASILCVLFAWFRLDHLRELDRLHR